jgi:hypothetical protein
MRTHFSQYVMVFNRADVEFGDRPLLRDHPMVVDWFYYSPDATLDLRTVGAHVARIRRSGVPRLNTLGRTLHRPYTKPDGLATWPYMAADHPPAVYLDGPETIAARGEASFVGHYAERHGELRLVWRTRHLDRVGAPAPWRVVAEDVWFRQAIPFPEAGTPGFEVQLQAGEYPAWGDWTQPPTRYVERTLVYTWDARTRRFRRTGSR